MPIIESSSGSPLVVFDLPFVDLEAAGDLLQTGQVNFDFPFVEIDATGSVRRDAAVDIEIPFLEIDANGSVDGVLNVFGQADFDLDLLDIEAAGSSLVNATVLFELEPLEIDANPSMATAEDFELNIILDILPPAPTGNYIDRWLPRLKVDGVEVPVKGGQYNEGDGSAAASLTVELARISDRSLMSSGAVVEFGFGRKVAGAWDEATFLTLIPDGRVQSTDQSVGWQNNHPTDAVQVTARSGSDKQFRVTPETDLVIYDSVRETLNQQDFDVLLDSGGNQLLTELLPVPNLTLYGLLSQVLGRCGFSGFTTNLPDFPILRADCPIGRSYLESISGYFGMFDPALFPVGNSIWIIDTTLVVPAGFPAPRSVEISDYQVLAIGDRREDVDGFLVHYIEDKRAYDYITSAVKTFTETSGEFGDPDYSETQVEQLFREYRRTSNPGLVLHRELYFERRTTSASGLGTINETRENFDFDSNGRFYRREKTQHSRIPNLNNPGEFTNALVNEETETLTYAAHPFQPRSQYVQRRVQQVRGLIVTDEDNPQLGEPFELDYLTAFRRGNLVESMTTRFGPIRSVIETAEPLRDGQVRVRPVVIDHLSRSIPEDDGQTRPGDVALSGIAPRQSRVLVLAGDDVGRSTGEIRSIHAGEMPPAHAIPWARRKLKALQSKNRTIEAQVIGYDAGLRKGIPATFTGRGGETIGTFLIIGRSVRFGPEGAFMNLTCKEV